MSDTITNARLRTGDGQRTVREAMQNFETATSEIAVAAKTFVIEYIDNVVLTGDEGQEKLDHLRELVHQREHEQDELLKTLAGQ